MIHPLPMQYDILRKMNIKKYYGNRKTDQNFQNFGVMETDFKDNSKDFNIEIIAHSIDKNELSTLTIKFFKLDWNMDGASNIEAEWQTLMGTMQTETQLYHAVCERRSYSSIEGIVSETYSMESQVESTAILAKFKEIKE